MTPAWDLTIRDRSERPVLAVEVKTIVGTSESWAAKFRRNLAAHGKLPDVPFLLLVFPDKFYLWVNDNHTAFMAEPEFTIDARPILQPYFDRAGVSDSHISGASLEVIVFSWLTSVMLRTAEELESFEMWVVDSGLHSAMAGGKVEYEVVA